MEKAGNNEIVRPKEKEFSYEHFYMRDEKYQQLVEKFPNYRGMCWVASLAMAHQMLYPDKDQPSVIDEVFRATYEAGGEEFRAKLANILNDSQERRHALGKTGLRLDYSLFDLNTAETDALILSKLPEVREALNEIMAQHNLGIKISYVPVLLGPGYKDRYYEKLINSMNNDNIPLITMSLINIKTKEKWGHAQVISGYRENILIISDPENMKPEALLKENFLKGLESDPTTYYQLKSSADVNIYGRNNIEMNGFLVVEKS